MTTFISFAGYRCALTAFGKGSEPSFTKLVTSSLIMATLACPAAMAVQQVIGIAVVTTLEVNLVEFAIAVI